MKKTKQNKTKKQQFKHEYRHPRKLRIINWYIPFSLNSNFYIVLKAALTFEEMILNLFYMVQQENKFHESIMSLHC